VLIALVLPWSRIVFGSIVGPSLGVAILWMMKERQPQTLAVAAAGVFAGTWLWNLMLNVRHANVIDIYTW
jgi:hypothetical protein